MALEKEETSLKTFNTAKKFAEEILFPLMEQFQSYQRKSDFGANKLEDAVLLSEELREIERFNGLKAMADACSSLAVAITSTVKLKNNKDEVQQLEKTIAYLERLKDIFYNQKNHFFISQYKNNQVVDTLNKEYFDKIKKIVQSCYVNIEILMTRNKLLFADASDEYKDDAELQDMIIKEYTEG